MSAFTLGHFESHVDGRRHESAARELLAQLASIDQNFGQSDPDSMRIIARCDLFLNPFPFGNTNGIVDTIGAGLVGVCKTGREVHEHIDQGLFERLGLPGWMVTSDEDGYVEAALRLIRDDTERGALRRAYSGPDKVLKLFEGRPEILGQKFEALQQQRQTPGFVPARA